MSNIRVRLRNNQSIDARLKPQQGVRVKDSTVYLYDPEMPGVSKDWAIKTDGLVSNEDYSAKAYAIGGVGTETNNAKYYAEVARGYTQDAQYGMYRYYFTAADWVQTGNKYKLSIPDYSVIVGIYKTINNKHTLRECDIEISNVGAEISSVDAFNGYALISQEVQQQFVYEQAVASNEWTIVHNLNKYPSVTVVDSAGTEFYPEVEYVDLTTCVARMNGATTGKAYLN